MISAIYAKEMKSFFRSPLTYIILAAFALITGWIFFNFLITYTESTQKIAPAAQGALDFYSQVVFRFIGNTNILFLFIVPLMGMNSFALEQQMGTMEIFDKAPIRLVQLVLAKYFAVVSYCFIIFSLTLFYPILLYFAGVQDFTFIFSSYIGAIFNILAFCSLAVFTSSLSNNPLTAGFLCFVGIMSFWMISWGINISDNYFLVENLKFVTLVTHFENIVRASFSLSDLFYYLSFIFLFLLLTFKKLEFTKWTN